MRIACEKAFSSRCGTETVGRMLQISRQPGSRIMLHACVVWMRKTGGVEKLKELDEFKEIFGESSEFAVRCFREFLRLLP